MYAMLKKKQKTQPALLFMMSKRGGISLMMRSKGAANQKKVTLKLRAVSKATAKESKDNNMEPEMSIIGPLYVL